VTEDLDLTDANSATRLKELRKLLGYSQRDMAVEFKVTHGAISQWESGDRPIPGPIVRLIEIYTENLGVIDAPITKKISATWASRAMRASIATGKIAARIVGSSLFGLIAGNERAAQLKAATDQKIGAELARTLGSLKGIAMKLGQYASYVDLNLPVDLRNELAKLQDSSSPLPANVAADLVWRALGAAPEKLFRHWSPMPFAAASIGQVHTAEMWDGTRVAVKVQYPEIRAAIEADIASLGALTSLLKAILRYQDAAALIEEIKDRIVEECDYDLEAANTAEFTDLLAPWPQVVVPKTHKKFCAPTVITSDFIDGKSFATFVAEADQVSKNNFGKLLFETTFALLLKHGIFSCDPNPGNFLFLGDGRVAFLDFGCVKRFGPKSKATIVGLFKASLDDDRAEVRRLILTTGAIPRPDSVDVDRVVDLIFAFIAPMRENRAYQFSPLYIERTWRQMMDNPDRLKLTVPPEFAFTSRLQWGICAILSRLGAEANWHQLLRAHL
jgi:predicted unusual protein kinase regulating ubiquinone biosynthesis (AarF/ABC1/UbiB family)/DNA-binding XRE family transcriptional regulator